MSDPFMDELKSDMQVVNRFSDSERLHNLDFFEIDQNGGQLSDVPPSVQKEFYGLFNQAIKYSQDAKAALGQANQMGGASKSGSKSGSKRSKSKRHLPPVLQIAQRLTQELQARGVIDKSGLKRNQFYGAMITLVKDAVSQIGDKTNIDAISAKADELVRDKLDYYLELRRKKLQAEAM